MPPWMVTWVPLGSQIAPPSRRASSAAFLLKLPVHERATVAILGDLPRRHLWVFGTVVEGSAAVETAFARAGRGTAHVAENVVGNCVLIDGVRSAIG